MMNARVCSRYHKIHELSKDLTDIMILLIDLFPSIVEHLPDHLIDLPIHMLFMINVRICT
jgi:hypothetical protein